MWLISNICTTCDSIKLTCNVLFKEVAGQSQSFKPSTTVFASKVFISCSPQPVVLVAYDWLFEISDQHPQA